eukprot:m51a1_g4445 putative leucine-rich repeat-containing protein c10orf11 homolog (235) ;mRNA; f:134299-135459
MTSCGADPDYQATYDEGKLMVAGQDLTAVPAGLSDRFPAATHLDLSFNSIAAVSHLGGFASLTALVLDNNALGSRQQFPPMPRLRLLSVNNNNITELDEFLDSLRPLTGLQTLSMLKNPACPSEYFGGDDDEYKRFRLYVLHRLRTLRFLDLRAVTDAERAEAERRGALLGHTAKPSEEQYRQDLRDAGDEHIPELPQQLAEAGKGGPAHFGVATYVYYGKQSEGNRFILNEDL